MRQGGKSYTACRSQHFLIRWLGLENASNHFGWSEVDIYIAVESWLPYLSTYYLWFSKHNIFFVSILFLTHHNGHCEPFVPWEYQFKDYSKMFLTLKQHFVCESNSNSLWAFKVYNPPNQWTMWKTTVNTEVSTHLIVILKTSFCSASMH